MSDPILEIVPEKDEEGNDRWIDDYGRLFFTIENKGGAIPAGIQARVEVSFKNIPEPYSESRALSSFPEQFTFRLPEAASDFIEILINTYIGGQKHRTTTVLLEKGKH